MTIKINDKEYKLKYTLRALIVFEKITKKPFSISTFTDQLVFFYSLLLANNQDMTLSFDDLLDEVDKHPEIIDQYKDFLLKDMKKNALLGGSEGESDDKKKE